MNKLGIALFCLAMLACVYLLSGDDTLMRIFLHWFGMRP